MAKQLPYFFQNSLGYYYFRYVLPRGLPSFFTENGKYKEIKVSFRTKNRKVAIEKYKYTKRFILNQINSGEIRMSFLQVLERAKDKAYNKNADKIGNLKTDKEKLTAINKSKDMAYQNRIVTLFSEIEKAKKLGFVDELYKAKSLGELDVILKASQSIEQDMKIEEIEKKKQQLLGNINQAGSFINSRITVDEIIRKFSYEKIYAKIWKEKTRMEYHSTFNNFFNRLKIVFVSEVTPERLRLHKDWLIQQNLTPQTVNKNLSRIDSLLKWAVSQGYVKELPSTSTIRVQANGKTSSNREALSIDVIKKIFLSEFYTKPRKNFTFDYPYQYWIPLIGLYSGMRINEISQLYCEDIKEIDGCMYFDVNKNTSDKSLKTKSSKRLVPIHPILINLGLIDLVQRQGNDNKILLFSDITHQRDGYGHYPSRWYNTKFRKKIGVTGKFLDFHAFRHTFTTNAIDLEYPIEHIQGILGHSNSTITGGTYGKAANLKLKHQEIVKSINYDFESEKIISFPNYPFRNGRNK